MKAIIRYLVALALSLTFSAAKAQLKGPAETNKQADVEIQSERKHEKDRQKRDEKAANQISQLDQQPKYKKIVKKKERLLLKPIIVTKEHKH
jgi:hypothetical protein